MRLAKRRGPIVLSNLPTVAGMVAAFRHLDDLYGETGARCRAVDSTSTWEADDDLPF